MFIGIDVTRNNVCIAAFWGVQTGRKYHHVDVELARSASDDSGPDDVLAQIIGACQEFSRIHGRINGIAVTAHERLSHDRTTFRTARRLNDWIAGLREALNGCFVMPGNSIEGGALAELYYGRKPTDDFWYVRLDADIQGCLVRHATDLPELFPGNIGHQQVVVGGGDFVVTCECGRRSCLQAYCSEKGIVDYFGVPSYALNSPQVSELAGWMAEGLLNILSVQQTTHVFIGGSAATSHLDLPKQVEAAMADRLIVPPALWSFTFGASAGEYGALAVLRRAWELKLQKRVEA